MRRRAVAAGVRLPGLATAAVSVLVAAACAGSGRRVATEFGAPHSPAEGVAVDRLVERCFDTTSGSDADADGLHDACELALARSFAPALVVESGHCGWDGAARRPAGGYVFGVQPTGVADRVRIAYLPAYVRDCGWSGAKCLLLYRACEGHSGDSEMIALEAQPAPGGRWRATAIFLSAHCFGDGACRWYGGSELTRFQWVADEHFGAPVVWVARGTHANYPSPSACDRGHHFFDSCDQHDVTVRFPVVSELQNVGSRKAPFLGRAISGCVAAVELWQVPRGAVAGAEECFWSERPFRGWTRTTSGDAPTPYAVYLREVLGW